MKRLLIISLKVTLENLITTKQKKFFETQAKEKINIA